MERFRETVSLNRANGQECKADITLTANTPADVIVDQMGVLSQAYDEAMTTYLTETEAYAKAHAAAGRKRGGWEATEQIFIAEAKRRAEGRGPSLDALKGEAKKAKKRDYQDVLDAEEDEKARDIVLRALRMNIDMIRTKIMMRQSALSAATDREKSARYGK